MFFLSLRFKNLLRLSSCSGFFHSTVRGRGGRCPHTRLNAARALLRKGGNRASAPPNHNQRFPVSRHIDNGFAVVIRPFRADKIRQNTVVVLFVHGFQFNSVKKFYMRLNQRFDAENPFFEVFAPLARTLGNKRKIACRNLP